GMRKGERRGWLWRTRESNDVKREVQNETSPPSISASGRGRGRAVGGVADRAGTSVSNGLAAMLLDRHRAIAPGLELPRPRGQELGVPFSMPVPRCSADTGRT